jgi:ketosteroid isomerase-like protein
MRNPSRLFLVLPTAFACWLTAASAFPRPQDTGNTFAPLDEWQQAILHGDSARLSSFYSTLPAAQVASPDNSSGTAADDVAFWKQWRVQGLARINIQIADQHNIATGMRQILFEVELTLRGSGGARKLYIPAVQTWAKEQDGWRIVQAQRKAPARLSQPFSTQKIIYPAGVDAKAEIAEGVARAGRTGKRVLVVFGANWCYDCHVLDAAFHSPEITLVLEKSFEVVHVDIGQKDKNLDLAEQYQIPLDRGIPAVAVLDGSGRLLFSQQQGEFEAARSLAPEDILRFLETWKPGGDKHRF